MASMEKIIREMRAVAAPGQRSLDALTVRRLRDLTSRLIAMRQHEAISEYERFLSIMKREICLPDGRVADRLAGTVILVVGGTGCVGSHLIAQLQRFRPARILSFSRGATRGWPRHPGVCHVAGDVRDRALIGALVRETQPDLIFHLAAQRLPGLAETLVHHTVSTNVLGTRNVLEAAAAAGTGHVVVASTGKALRPFSSDVYAASKRVAEWVAAGFAASGEQSCSAVRFTHVVDNSDIHKRLEGWADSAGPVRLHSPEIAFYAQSATECAQLLLSASLDERRRELLIHAINYFGWPVSLLDLTLGVLAARGSDAPVYFAGYEPGYEERPFPGLYDPVTAVEVSPLFNAFESAATVASACSMTNVSPAAMTSTGNASELLAGLAATCDRTDDPHAVRTALGELSWAVLDDSLAASPAPALARVARIAERHGEALTPEHRRILNSIQRWAREQSVG